MKKIFGSITLLLLLTIALQSLCACSAGRDEEIKSVSYVDEEYHFTLKYPSNFSKPNKEELDEDGDEAMYTLTSGDEKITLSCMFNTEDSFYDYINAYTNKNKYNKNNITFKNASSLVLDCREEKKPTYYIISATKRMIYTLEYALVGEATEAYNKKCELLDFEFSLYANVPKDNDSLSDPVTLNNGAFDIRIPANCTYTLTPALDEIPYKTVEVEEETDGEKYKKEIQIVDTDKYNGIFAYTDMYAVYTGSYTEQNAVAARSEVQNNSIEFDAQRIAELLGGKITACEASDSGEVRENNEKTYVIFNFKCKFGKTDCTGTYMIGYAENGSCFEYAYLKKPKTPTGEAQQLYDMLASADFPENK